MLEPRPNLRSWLKRGAVLLALLVAVWLVASLWYHLPPLAFARQAARVAATPVLSVVYRSDDRQTDAMAARYRVGMQQPAGSTALKSWLALSSREPAIKLLNAADLVELDDRIPFVYETSSAQFLSTFRQTYQLDEAVKGASDEYDAMLKLATWVGTRFDHGKDPVPGGDQGCDPTAVVASGQAGSRYWCEIASRVMLHAANSLGWQARIITGSRDGYLWEHAVAEVWSNQFNKWFAIDTDFNVVFETGGVPLSAFELSTAGERLQREGKLQVRHIAPAKASLPLIDLVPFYAYVHVDMRTDWCTRSLARGSPAGGDRATWWTARPAIAHILTARVRVDDAKKFDWQVNEVAIYATAAEKTDAGTRLHIALAGYSPVFERFELSVDDAAWSAVDNAAQTLTLGAGDHSVRARLLTRNGATGPVSKVAFHIAGPGEGAR